MALTRRERKEQLRRLTTKQKYFAEEINVSETTLSNVLNGKTQLYAKDTVQKVREAVAARIGLPVEDVWGKVA